MGTPSRSSHCHKTCTGTCNHPHATFELPACCRTEDVWAVPYSNAHVPATTASSGGYALLTQCDQARQCSMSTNLGCKAAPGPLKPAPGWSALQGELTGRGAMSQQHPSACPWISATPAASHAVRPLREGQCQGPAAPAEPAFSDNGMRNGLQWGGPSHSNCSWQAPLLSSHTSGQSLDAGIDRNSLNRGGGCPRQRLPAEPAPPTNALVNGT